MCKINKIICVIFCLLSFSQNVFANDVSTQYNLKESKNIINNKSFDEITLGDVIQKDSVSDDTKRRIQLLLDESHTQLDSYRTANANHYKQVESQLLEINKRINKIQDFYDEMESSLHLAKWIIISLSVGILCYTAIIIAMWRNIVVINKSDVKLIFSADKIKKYIKLLEKRVDMLEIIFKKNGKDK